jgi:hypothetical protein
VITNGRYAVSLSGTNSLVVDSIIANNILNTLINSGDEAVFIGNGTNNYVSGNTGNNLMRTLSYDDLPDWLKNHKTVQPKTPALPDISQMSLKIPKIDKPTNPFIKPTNTKENSTGSGLTDEKGQGNMPWNQKGQNNGLKNTNNKQNTANTNGNSNTNTSNDQSKNNNPTSSNNNQNRGSINQKTPDTQKSSPSDTGSSAAPKKAYEVKEKAKKIINKDNYLPSIIASAIILLLILAGYKRKNNTEEE